MSKDEWKLLWYGLLTALLMGLVLVPILMHNIHFPKLAAEAILAIIAGAVFSSLRTENVPYRERRLNVVAGATDAARAMLLTSCRKVELLAAISGFL